MIVHQQSIKGYTLIELLLVLALSLKHLLKGTNSYAVEIFNPLLPDSRRKMRGSKKQEAGTQATKFIVCTYDILSIKRVTRKFHVAATTAAKKCTKSVLHMQRCFFANYTFWFLFVCLFVFFGRPRCRRRLALHDFIFGLSKLQRVVKGIFVTLYPPFFFP